MIGWWVLGTALATEVTIGWVSPPVGIEVASTHTTELSLVVQPERTDKKGRLLDPIDLGKRHEQVSTVARGPHGLDVAWSVNRQADHGPDGQRAFDLPVAGRRYRVAGTTVMSGDADEQAIAKEAAKLFGMLKSARDTVGGTWAIGEARPAASMFAGIVRDAPGSPRVEGTVRLIAVDGGLGRFDVDLAIRSSGEAFSGVNVTFAADLKGTWVVRLADGWTEALEVAGPVRVRGSAWRMGAEIPFAGDGTYRSTTALTYSTP